MILNYRNFANAKTTIGRLRSRLDLLRHRRGTWKEAQNWQFEAELLVKRIAEISLELEEYSRLERQNLAIPALKNLLQLPDYMIKRRIRSGISQIELAKRLGFSRNSILIYERTRYAGATLSRILQIDALIKELETTREFEISRFLECAEARDQF